MKILLSGAVILALWIGGGAYWYTCKIKGLCADSEIGVELSTALSQPARAAPPKPQFNWKIQENGTTLFTFSERPSVKKNLPEIKIPEPAFPAIDSIRAYLLVHPDKYVNVTGSFGMEEKYVGESENLGMARAEIFREMLIAAGIDPNRIRTQSQESKLNFDEDDVGDGGISVEIVSGGKQITEIVETVEAAAEEEKEEKVVDDITNRTLYAGFGEVKFAPDPTLASYAAEVKAYLANHPNAIVHITGHTDNVGNADVNLRFGKWRASKVRSYFVSQGISSKRIQVASKGMSAPIASNDTEEGRAKNRRIVVQIQ